MWAQYSLYTLPLKNGRLRKPEELPKERSLLDCMIHKATSEATAGKKVYLLAMGTGERSLWRRILVTQSGIIEWAREAKGELHACAPRIPPRAFDVSHWIDAAVEEGATVIIYGADMIYSTYMAAASDLKKAQKKKNCEIIFAWRDEELPVQSPAKRFEAWDELNVQREKPIPVHTPFKLTKEECYSNPRLMQDPLLLYCPSKELAYKLDPEDPWDRRLLDAFNSANKKA